MRYRHLAACALVAACGSSTPPPAQPAPPPPVVAAPEPPHVDATATKPAPAEDPYLWLEDVTGDKSLAWVRERNKASQGELEAAPGFTVLRDRFRTILESKDKLPYATKRGRYLYNFWQDDANPRGLIRRTSLAEYKKAKPAWETVLDIDQLNKDEHASWVFKGEGCLYPKYERCLVELSPGGGDSVVIRELDMVKKKFVDGGFSLPEGKSSLGWKDENTVYVATDFGPGTMTPSGYPRIVKEWKRGTPITAAVTVYEAQPTDVAAGASRAWDHGKSYDLVSREISAFTSETFLRGKDGKLVKIDVPVDASPDIWNDQLLVTLRTDWKVGDKTWPKGALLATSLPAFLAGKRDFTMLYAPSPTTSLDSTAGLKSSIVMNELDNVHNKLSVWTLGAAGWKHKPMAGIAGGDLATRSVWAVDSDGTSDDYWLSTSGFIEPSTLALGALGKAAAPLKKSPAFFDSTGLVVEQHFATSKDGTKIPYFQISKDKLALDGSHPTILYGYGGFEISLTPGYDPVSGAAWIERGGVYVVANIRGGAEYGPAWHQAALKHDRQRAYDDFIAVGEDLIARKVTSTPHLGINGGSNGGLLMGVMLVERPDLWGAIVCQAPLLDMKRYHKLLAGASWMEEYGDPDNAEDWAALSKFSPYQNVKAGTKYPRTLFTSSTRDDRVHPGHARKMVARMLEQGHDVLYYENIEGGHGGAADAEQAAYVNALKYTFFAKQLGLQ
ncbi:MAG TPA: prolyl oligopeptidase family serine peptidase [Kofleriaceae bacterium]|jgi:prolyl oligopeptidase